MREQELIDRLIDDARLSRSGVLGLSGEVGSGKSSLLEYAATRASGLEVLRARGVQSEAHIPFAGLFELLLPALGALERISTPQREALEGALALRPAVARDRFAIGAATLALFAAYSEDVPVIVLLDDAQWIDGSSADALRFAFRRLVVDGIAVLIATRHDEASLLDRSDFHIHRIEGLDRTATEELVRLHGSPRGDLSEGLLNRMHLGTGGNPLALIELSGNPDSFADYGPLDRPLSVVTTIGQVYFDRYAALPEATRGLLLLIAAGGSTRFTLLQRAAQRAGFDVRDVEPAEAIGLVTIGSDQVEFRHPLIRSAVYAGAAPDQRRAMHRVFADVLPDTEVDRRAWHLALAALGTDAAASSALEQAALRARERSAYNVASEAFERATSLTPFDSDRASLLLRSADNAWLAGSARRAVGLLDLALDEPAYADVTASIAQLRGHVAARLGPLHQGITILLDGAELCADADPDRAVVMLAEAVNAAFYGCDTAAMKFAVSRIEAILALCVGRLAPFFGAMAQGMTLIFSGQGESDGAAKGAERIREAVRLAEGDEGLVTELLADPRLLAWVAMGPLWLREIGSGHDLVDLAMDTARQHSAVGVLPFLLSHVAIDAAAAHRWDEARSGFHEAIALSREAEQVTDLAFALSGLASLEARAGNEEWCRMHADEAMRLGRSHGLVLSEIWATGALADLEFGLGNAAQALALYLAKDAILQARSVADVDLSPDPELVELYLRLGQRSQAIVRLDGYNARARAKGQPWALARAARCRAVLAPASEFEAFFSESLALHAHTPDRFELARTHLAYGARLRRGRQRTRARDHLRICLDIFDSLGAEPWAQMARHELAATGETARPRNPSTREQLTPQELQIALLLANGRTTREAAATCFLSPKTVEYHLRSVYRKFGINTREQLAQLLSPATR